MRVKPDLDQALFKFMDMMEAYCKEEERIDELHRRGYRILQKPAAFCFGMDAVLLADFAAAFTGARVLDLCCGGGIVPILMQARRPEAQYFGLEIQPEMAEMAIRSVQMNGLEASIHITEGDLRGIRSFYAPHSMDAVTVNPPYMKAPDGLKNQNAAMTIARHEVSCTLEDVVQASAYALKARGRLYMVHRPRRLPQVLTCLKTAGLEPKRLRMVHPYAEKEANLVLIEAVRGGGEEMHVLPPLIVYDAAGRYTEEIYEIYGYEHDRSTDGSAGSVQQL